MRKRALRARDLVGVLLVGAVLLTGCAAHPGTNLVPQTGAPTGGGLSTPSGAPTPVTGPVAGVAIALGKPAIVISPCAGDVVTEVGAYAKGNNDVTNNVWLVKSEKARRLAVIGIGDTPVGYNTVVQYTAPSSLSALSGKVIVKPANGPAFTVSTVDSFADATAEQILVNGNYLSFSDFMTQYSLCKAKS